MCVCVAARLEGVACACAARKKSIQSDRAATTMYLCECAIARARIFIPPRSLVVVAHARVTLRSGCKPDSARVGARDKYKNISPLTSLVFFLYFFVCRFCPRQFSTSNPAAAAALSFRPRPMRTPRYRVCRLKQRKNEGARARKGWMVGGEREGKRETEKPLSSNNSALNSVRCVD